MGNAAAEAIKAAANEAGVDFAVMARAIHDRTRWAAASMNLHSMRNPAEWSLVRLVDSAIQNDAVMDWLTMHSRSVSFPHATREDWARADAAATQMLLVSQGPKE